MGLGVQPEDLEMDEGLIFPDGETVTLVCLDTHDNVSKELITLNCKVLDGEHVNKFHKIFLSKRRDKPFLVRKLRDFAKAFYTKEELLSGDQPLSRLYLRKFSAVAGEPRPHNGKIYQDLTTWEDLGESTPQEVPSKSTPQQVPATPAPSSADIPF